MRKFLLSFLVLASFAYYAYYEKTFAKGLNATIAPTRKPIKPSPSNSPAQGLPPEDRGPYKDGEFTGPDADALYGTVQVKAIIKNGKITDVHFLKYPSDRRTSLEINQLAMPHLIREAVVAQSAKVDGVTGATQTSHGFIKSLEGALNQAL